MHIQWPETLYTMTLLSVPVGGVQTLTFNEFIGGMINPQYGQIVIFQNNKSYGIITGINTTAQTIDVTRITDNSLQSTARFWTATTVLGTAGNQTTLDRGRIINPPQYSGDPKIGDIVIDPQEKCGIIFAISGTDYSVSTVITALQQENLTSATDIMGFYIRFRCNKYDINKPFQQGGPPKILGVIVDCPDTLESYTYEGVNLGWVKYNQAGGTPTPVIVTDDTLEGNGYTGDPLKVWVAPKSYDPNEVVKIGDTREGMMNGVQGIWRWSAGQDQAWERHDVYVYDHTSPNAHAFNIGDEFSTWFSGYDGFFWQANIIFTAVGINDMLSHIMQGDLTLICNSPWASGQTYNVGQTVYRLGILDKYWVCINGPVTQTQFNEFMGISYWRLLADVGSNINVRPPDPNAPLIIEGRSVGEIIRWHWTWTKLPAGWKKCDGSFISKSVYAILYSVIEDTEMPAGNTPDPNNFYLPWENNAIIFTGVF